MCGHIQDHYPEAMAAVVFQFLFDMDLISAESIQGHDNEGVTFSQQLVAQSLIGFSFKGLSARLLADDIPVIDAEVLKCDQLAIQILLLGTYPGVPIYLLHSYLHNVRKGPLEF